MQLRSIRSFGRTRILVAVTVIPVLIAVSLAQAQSSLKSSSAANAYQRGLAAINAGELAQAENELEQAVKLNPANADAQLVLGGVLLQKGDVRGAIEHLRTATKLKPNSANVHLSLGQALLAANQADAALVEL